MRQKRLLPCVFIRTGQEVWTCQADPSVHGTRSETFIVIHLGKRLVLIGGTAYAGEIKKSIFTIMNYLLPMSGSFPCTVRPTSVAAETRPCSSG
jgi:ATP-dependent phosphoenolpyruvate carboxykinase